jgi:exopolysaccharide biosynthesis operon protein EpsL
MTMPRSRPLALCPLALCLLSLLCCPAVQAGPGDALQLYGRLGWAHDDNLLRVPEGTAAFDNRYGDSWITREGGLLFDQTYSRQRIAAIAKLSKVTFDHFRQLDYDGKDLQATWFWQLGNRFQGQANATYNQVLAPYTDFLSNERNLRRQRHQFVDGAWNLHPRWRLRVAGARDKFDYELLSQRSNNRTETASELEGDYLARSGSTVGLVLRQLKGKYAFRRPFAGLLLSDDFTQDELKARIEWLASGHTTVQVLAGWAQRDQPSLGPDKTSGANGRVNAIYQRSKVKVTAAAWRDFAALESTVVSYTLNKGASLGATWDATAKVKVDGSAAYERRAYNPRLAFAGSDNLNDSVRVGTVRATYSLRPTVQLSAEFAHEARSGSPVLGTGRFSSNSVQVNASAQF